MYDGLFDRWREGEREAYINRFMMNGWMNE